MNNSILRRTFLKHGTAVVGAGAACGLAGVQEAAAQTAKAPVYFTKDISVESLLKLYAKVNKNLTGKVAIKLHSGEPKGPNLLPIEFIKALQPRVPNSTIVECNVLYPGPRQATEGHRETLKTNGFDFCAVDIMDADGDAMLPIPGMRKFLDTKQSLYTPGTHLTEIAVGKSLLNYDSLLVYTHFKGHTMGGFGGSLKNIAIGCGSGKGGKLQVHGKQWQRGNEFLERMVEAGKGITSRFGTRIAYINILKNLSVDCDCDGRGAKPTCGDIGMLASTDILAIDKASVDLVYAQPEAQRHDLVERIESRGGKRQLEYMKILGMGNDQYELIAV